MTDTEYTPITAKGVKKCRSKSAYGYCARRQHKGDPLHVVAIGGGSDPVSDPAVWFAYGRGINPGYRYASLQPMHVPPWDEVE